MKRFNCNDNPWVIAAFNIYLPLHSLLEYHTNSYALIWRVAWWFLGSSRQWWKGCGEGGWEIMHLDKRFLIVIVIVACGKHFYYGTVYIAKSKRCDKVVVVNRGWIFTLDYTILSTCRRLVVDLHWAGSSSIDRSIIVVSIQINLSFFVFYPKFRLHYLCCVRSKCGKQKLSLLEVKVRSSSVTHPPVLERAHALLDDGSVYYVYCYWKY